VRVLHEIEDGVASFGRPTGGDGRLSFPMYARFLSKGDSLHLAEDELEFLRACLMTTGAMLTILTISGASSSPRFAPIAQGAMVPKLSKADW
jgi:hypothetical protein